MNSEFRIGRLSLALFIAISVHMGLPGTKQEIAADSQSAKKEFKVTREPALEQWQAVRSELDLIYLSYPHLNPLEQQTLLEYSWQARAQVKSISTSLQTIAYLLTHSESEFTQIDLALQTLTNSLRAYSSNPNNNSND